MLRRLLLLALLACAPYAYAQGQNNTSKATEKKDATQIDYKQMGAPMPVLRLAPVYDTSGYIVNTEMILKDSLSHKKRKKKMAQEVIQDKSKKIVTNADVDNRANLLVMMFNPTCSHCEDQAERMEKNIAYFSNSKMLMIATPNQGQYVPAFVKNHHVASYPSFIVGVDSSNFIDKVFLYQALPQINIYNADRKLIRTFTGEVSVDSLKQYIE
jgi:hypothetical protein